MCRGGSSVRRRRGGGIKGVAWWSWGGEWFILWGRRGGFVRGRGMCSSVYSIDL